jgi:hypothetical protein
MNVMKVVRKSSDFRRWRILITTAAALFYRFKFAVVHSNVTS